MKRSELEREVAVAALAGTRAGEDLLVQGFETFHAVRHLLQVAVRSALEGKGRRSVVRINIGRGTKIELPLLPFGYVPRAPGQTGQPSSAGLPLARLIVRTGRSYHLGYTPSASASSVASRLKGDVKMLIRVCLPAWNVHASSAITWRSRAPDG